MGRLTIVLPDKTEQAIRAHVGRRGGRKGDISKFIDEAVNKQIFWQGVEDMRESFTDLSPQEVDDLVEEAIAWARAHRS